MRGRTEFTGRANPSRTTLRTLVRPTANGYIPTNNKEVVYDKPITIDWQTIPEGEVDVRAIVGISITITISISITITTTYSFKCVIFTT